MGTFLFLFFIFASVFLLTGRDRTLGVERTRRLLESQGVNLDVVDVSIVFFSFL